MISGIGKNEDPTAYFTRVKQRAPGGERVVNGSLVFVGPPKREPRNGRIIVHNRVAHTLTQIPGAHGFSRVDPTKGRRLRSMSVWLGRRETLPLPRPTCLHLRRRRVRHRIR